MIASENSFEPHSRDALPNSRKVYVPGTLHPDLRVPMREIALSPTKSMDGTLSENAPVRVYDCSGPWGDPEFLGDVEQGLPALRANWILKRGDVEEYDGREVKPQDNGYLSGKHAEYASKAEKNRLVEFPGLRVTLSLGVSSIALGARSSQELLAQADEALYAAKARGRNQVASWEGTPAEVSAALAAH